MFRAANLCLFHPDLRLLYWVFVYYNFESLLFLFVGPKPLVLNVQQLYLTFRDEWFHPGIISFL